MLGADSIHRDQRRAAKKAIRFSSTSRRLVEGEIVWAPGIEGGLVLTTRGGDFELDLGQDLSIGYLSHSGTEVELYFQESFTFRLLTTEAAVALATHGNDVVLIGLADRDEITKLGRREYESLVTGARHAALPDFASIFRTTLAMAKNYKEGSTTFRTISPQATVRHGQQCPLTLPKARIQVVATA